MICKFSLELSNITLNISNFSMKACFESGTLEQFFSKIKFIAEISGKMRKDMDQLRRKFLREMFAQNDRLFLFMQTNTQ